MVTQPVKSVPVSQRVTGVQPRPKPEIEIGISHYLPFSTPFRNAWEVLRDEEITVRQLAAMRKTDGQARALYRLITLPVRAALKGSTFLPEDHVDGGEDEAEFVETMFTLPINAGGMTVPFGRVIAQLLLAVFDGFSAFEMVYWSPQDGPLKGKWTLKKLAHRPSETLTFLIDAHGDYAGLRQQTVFKGEALDKVLPAAHTVYWAANEEEKPFYGQSYFLSAFYHWDKKFKLYAIAHIAAQRAAVGTRVGKLPRNPGLEEKNEFKKALSNLGVAQYMTIPEDYEVESLKEVPDFDFLAYINHHNSQMSKSVLAAFFDEQQGTGGDASLVDFGRQSDSLFLLMLQTIMGEIEEVINQKIIPRFIDWNFGSGKYPKFQFGSLSDEQKSKMFDLFKTLAVAGQSLTIQPEFVHELEKQVAGELGLEIDWETVEAEIAAEAEEAAALEAMSGGMSGQAGAAVTGSPIVDPGLLPQAFTLSALGGERLSLSAEAADLLAEAYNTVTLTRGVPRHGGRKVVRTPAGAETYGVPIGTPITRDIAERTAQDGVKGKPFGGGIRGTQGGGPGAKGKRQVYGGGPGAKAQEPGNVVTEPNAGGMKPKRTFIHPKQPGARLIDFGDGTVAIQDANGQMSTRQRFDIQAFLRLGWQADAPADRDPPTKARTTRGDTPKPAKTKGRAGSR